MKIEHGMDIKRELIIQLGLDPDGEFIEVKTEEEAERLAKQGIRCTPYATVSESYGYYHEEVVYSDHDLNALIKLRMLRNSNIIKRCCVFFAVIVAIGVMMSLISGIQIISVFHSLR